MSKYSEKADFPPKLIHIVQKKAQPSFLSPLFTFCCGYSVSHKLLFERKVETSFQATALYNQSNLSQSPSWWIFSVRHISHQFVIVSHFIPLAHTELRSVVIALISPLDFRVPSELPEVSVSHLLPCIEKGRNGAGFLSTS